MTDAAVRPCYRTNKVQNIQTRPNKTYCFLETHFPLIFFCFHLAHISKCSTIVFKVGPAALKDWGRALTFAVQSGKRRNGINFYFFQIFSLLQFFVSMYDYLRKPRCLRPQAQSPTTTTSGSSCPAPTYW